MRLAIAVIACWLLSVDVRDYELNDEAATES